MGRRPGHSDGLSTTDHQQRQGRAGRESGAPTPARIRSSKPHAAPSALPIAHERTANPARRIEDRIGTSRWRAQDAHVCVVICASMVIDRETPKTANRFRMPALRPFRMGTKRAVIVIYEDGIVRVRHRHDDLLGLDDQSVDELKAALDALPSPAAP